MMAVSKVERGLDTSKLSVGDSVAFRCCLTPKVIVSGIIREFQQNRTVVALNNCSTQSEGSESINHSDRESNNYILPKVAVFSSVQELSEAEKLF